MLLLNSYSVNAFVLERKDAHKVSHRVLGFYCGHHPIVLEELSGSVKVTRGCLAGLDTTNKLVNQHIL